MCHYCTFCNSVLFTIHWVSFEFGHTVSLFIMGWKSVDIITSWLYQLEGRENKGRRERGKVNMKREREKVRRKITFTEVVKWCIISLPNTSSLVPTAPQNVTLSNINQRTIVVAWEAPAMTNGILGPYIVCTWSLLDSQPSIEWTPFI